MWQTVAKYDLFDIVDLYTPQVNQSPSGRSDDDMVDTMDI